MPASRCGESQERLREPFSLPIARILGFALLSTFWIYSSTWAEDLPCADCHESDPDPAAVAESVHGGMECADCHTGVEDFPHSEEASRVDCSMCHDDLMAEYGESIHGQARANGDTDAPSCSACHGDIHTLVPSTSEASPVHASQLPATCGQCHSDPEVVRKYGISEATFYAWRKKYGGLGIADVRRLKQLESENRRLKQLVADLSLDKEMLQEVVKKKL